MQHLAIAAIATVIALGAGAGAVTNVGPSDNSAASMSDAANPLVDGQAMLLNSTIYDNAARSPEHGRFVAALKASGVAELLKGKGTFTVFAPTDAAFAALSPSVRSNLFNPARRAELARAMRYFVVAGRLDSRTLLERIGENGGSVKLKTLEGGAIVATLNGPTNISLMDENGIVADIAVYDIYQSNRVIHVIDRVMTPAAISPKPTEVGMLGASTSSRF